MKKQLFILIAGFFCLNSFAQTPPSYIPVNGLVGWWPFNGNANDESGNGNNGTLVGNTSLANDRFGTSNSAYTFDGNGDYIDCGNSPSVNITGSLTISAWFYALDYNDARGILTKSPLPPVDDGYQLVVGALVPLDITFLNTNCGYVAPTLTWVHVVTVFDSITQTVSQYTNGILDTAISVTFNVIGTSPDNLCLGTHRPTFTPNWSWSGTLDDIGIWNRALTASEISQVYYGPTIGVKVLEPENEFVVYPNPARDLILIKLDIEAQPRNYSIIDFLGHRLIAGTLIGETTTVDISALADGIYFLELTGQAKQTVKLIKN
jgi:hypothetical protein